MSANHQWFAVLNEKDEIIFASPNNEAACQQHIKTQQQWMPKASNWKVREIRNAQTQRYLDHLSNQRKESAMNTLVPEDLPYSTNPPNSSSSSSTSSYTRAYAVGYYYGRALQNTGATMPEEDLALKDHTGFQLGVEDGFRDFQDIDLTNQALTTKAQE